MYIFIEIDMSNQLPQI